MGNEAIGVPEERRVHLFRNGRSQVLRIPRASIETGPDGLPAAAFEAPRRPFGARFGPFAACARASARNLLTDAAYRGTFESVNQE